MAFLAALSREIDSMLFDVIACVVIVQSVGTEKSVFVGDIFRLLLLLRLSPSFIFFFLRHSFLMKNNEMNSD